jgi:hypothetical protein
MQRHSAVVRQVARMSAAICGVNANENPRMSLRSSGLRLLERHELWLGSVEWIVEALHLKFDDALAFTPSLDFRHIGSTWKFAE